MSADLKSCPFCGGRPYSSITTRGSVIRCCECSAKMEHRKMAGHYQSIAMSRKWSYSIIREEWNNRAEMKGEQNDLQV